MAILHLHPLGVLGADQYDQTSATATFRSLGKAIENNDPKTFIGMIAFSEKSPYSLLVKEIWEGTGGHMPRFGLNSDTMAGASLARVARFFRDAEVLKDALVPHAEPKRLEERALLLRWAEGRILRKEHFLLLQNESAWKWSIDLFEHDEDIHDFSSPSEACLAVAQALEFQLVGEVVKTYAASSKGGLSDKEWQRILEDRLLRKKKYERDEIWSRPDLRSIRSLLEEEMIPPPAGQEPTKCKVWLLGWDDKKRKQFEIFEREGKEWKWVPKAEYFWYPTKVEK